MNSTHTAAAHSGSFSATRDPASGAAGHDDLAVHLGSSPVPDRSLRTASWRRTLPVATSAPTTSRSLCTSGRETLTISKNSKSL
jgi:hypothetical protein